MRATASELDSLARKYRTLLALRRGKFTLTTPFARALAAEFPGALRELDVLPLDILAARLADVGSASREDRDAAAWISPMIVYHVRMRQLLAVKRLLGGERCPNAERAATIARVLGPECDATLVERVAAPPSGRLNRLAFELVARELGRAESEIEGLLFPRAARGEQPSA